MLSGGTTWIPRSTAPRAIQDQHRQPASRRLRDRGHPAGRGTRHAGAGDLPWHPGHQRRLRRHAAPAPSQSRRSRGPPAGPRQLRRRRPRRPAGPGLARGAGCRRAGARHQVPPPPGSRPVGDGLVVTGTSALDDLVEAIELPERRFVLGVQWHPEADDRSRVATLSSRRPRSTASHATKSPPDAALADDAGLRVARASYTPPEPYRRVQGPGSRARAAPPSRVRADQSPRARAATSSRLAPSSPTRTSTRASDPGRSGIVASATSRRPAWLSWRRATWASSRDRRCRPRARPPSAPPTSPATWPDEQCRHRDGARTLGHQLGALEQEHHRLGGLVLGDEHELIDPARDQLQRELARALDRDPVGDRQRRVDRHRLAGRQ